MLAYLEHKYLIDRAEVQNDAFAAHFLGQSEVLGVFIDLAILFLALNARKARFGRKGHFDLAEVDLPITLSISLHAATDEKREAIMPINKKWCINKLLTACVDYYKKTGRRISFEYTLISGKNDSTEDARELGTILKTAFRGTGAPIHVNLIRVNEVKESGFKEGSVEGANEFAKTLENMGVVATVRRRLGADVNAACGQLRRNAAKNQ